MSMARYALETSLPLMHLVRGENPLKPLKITMAIIFSYPFYLWLLKSNSHFTVGYEKVIATLL